MAAISKPFFGRRRTLPFSRSTCKFQRFSSSPINIEFVICCMGWKQLLSTEISAGSWKTLILILNKFFQTHLGYPLDFIFFFYRHVMGGIPLPSRGIVGKNRSNRSICVQQSLEWSLCKHKFFLLYLQNV